jgi:uncharacterized membrane protein YfhO
VAYSGDISPVNTSADAIKPWREPMQTKITSHPFESITTDTFAQAAAGAHMTLASVDQNKLTFTRNLGSSQRLLFLSPPYPGWKVRISEPNSNDQSAELKPSGAILSVLTLPKTNAASSKVTISFEPFSFRLGMFLSLIGLAAFACFASTTRREAIP